MSSGKAIQGGAQTEEMLRDYFLEAGYFAVRGVPYYHDGVAVTDVDLWVYVRLGPLTRHRAVVDTKRSQRPKALERIVWARGLRDMLAVQQAIVATTDRRKSISEFALDHGVTVLDGAFLQRLSSRSTSQPSRRLRDEQMLSVLEKATGDRVGQQWRERWHRGKGRLLTGLEFDGCNAWLEDVRFFAEQSVGEHGSPGGALATRLFYLSVAYFLIGLDYTSASFAFEPEDERIRVLADGFRYGTHGRERAETLIRQAGQLAAAYVPKPAGLVAKIAADAERATMEVRADILAQFFGKTDKVGTLFRLALDFERVAYDTEFQPPAALAVELQAAISVFLDHFRIERGVFFRLPGSLVSHATEPAARAQPRLPQLSPEGEIEDHPPRPAQSGRRH